MIGLELDQEIEKSFFFCRDEFIHIEKKLHE